MKAKKSSATPPTNNSKSKISVKISLPDLSRFPKINGFYQKVSKRCHEFCSKSLSVLYPDQNLHYCIRSTYEQKDGMIIIHLYTSLSNRQSMRLLYSSEQTHVWREFDQLLIKTYRKQSNIKNRTA